MLSARGTKTIRLQRRRSGLDFSIKGGREHGIGVVISWIKEGGAAAKSLNLGDEILAVNGDPLYGLSHRQVVNKLKSAGPSVVLLVHPNQTLQDIFSNSTSTYPERPAVLVLPLAGAEDSVVVASPLPQGWGQKVDQKTGRVYFENHYTCTSCWLDPRSRQPIPMESFQWHSLPPGWESHTDERGEIYYVNHHTQTTHWDSPRGMRQLRLLQQLREFLTTQKEKMKSEEEELAGKRRLLLAKNAELNLQQPVSHDLQQPQPVSHDPVSHDPEEAEGEVKVDSRHDLFDDIMLLNEEVDAHDAHLSVIRCHLHSLAAILQSAKVEELGERDPDQVGAELALSLARELSALHRTVQKVLELMESISKQRRKEDSLTPLHHMLQLPTLVEEGSLQERQCWIHVLPDRLTAKTNCELGVELVLTREAVLYGQSLQEKLGVLYRQALSHQGWEQLLEQLATLDFQLLQELYTEEHSGFREKLEKLMTL